MQPSQERSWLEKTWVGFQQPVKNEDDCKWVHLEAVKIYIPHVLERLIFSIFYAKKIIFVSKVNNMKVKIIA